MGNFEAAATATKSHHMHSDSFASYSSSELDTVSTRSFFQDHSITLGSLIGMTPVDRNVLLAKSFLSEELERASMINLPHDSVESDEEVFSCCICVTFMDNVLPGRTSSRY
ncbi:hypothetical protein BHE74_00029591 [Ensete ventricosum]|nr:hypothetical protein GW17_00010078 [Ensete ventricosum]RWW63241.1 hypothetical protein BHE74_00029591 [Ensete ventricosum]RZS09801.1 hypothetical protein BHM03_00040910 [Ensete ventricosum]